MSPKTEAWERLGLADGSDSSYDELESVDGFYRGLGVSSIHSQDSRDRSNESVSTVQSSESDSTVQTKSTAVSIGVRDGTKDLLLKWSTKVELITILNEYSAILYGKTPDDEQAILDKTNTLLQTLSGLPMKLKEKSNDGRNGPNSANSDAASNFADLGAADLGAANLNVTDSSTAVSNAAGPKAADLKASNLNSAGSNSPSKPNNAEQSKTNGELMLDLKWKIRSKIIEALTTNQTLAIYNRLYVSNESKRGLIQKNNDLVQVLLGLRVRLVEKEKYCHLFDEQASKEDKEENEEKDTLENTPGKAANLSHGGVKGPTFENNAEMIARMATLGISSTIAHINAAEKLEFTFEIDEFTKFCTEQRRRESRCFSWQNVDWTLSARIGSDANATESLEVYLVLKHYNSSPWPCKVKFILTLLGQATGARNKIMRPLSYTFKQVEGYGFTKFCRLADVTRAENGFVLNDSIKIRFLGMRSPIE